MSDTVHNLLIKENIIEGKKINVLPKKSPIKKEAEKIEAQVNLPADKADKIDKKEIPSEDEEASKEEREEETNVAELGAKDIAQADSLPNDSPQEK